MSSLWYFVLAAEQTRTLENIVPGVLHLRPLWPALWPQAFLSSLTESFILSFTHLSYSVQAAKTEYHSLGGLNNNFLGGWSWPPGPLHMIFPLPLPQVNPDSPTRRPAVPCPVLCTYIWVPYDLNYGPSKDVEVLNPSAWKCDLIWKLSLCNWSSEKEIIRISHNPISPVFLPKKEIWTWKQT